MPIGDKGVEDVDDDSSESTMKRYAALMLFIHQRSFLT